MSDQNFHIKHQLQFPQLFSPELKSFLVALHDRFNPRRKQLLQNRSSRQLDFDQGILPTFLPETELIRNSDWVCAPLPQKLLDRRVEITGPVDAKMIINALNSGASAFMADFEDSNSPTWENCMQGQMNLAEAIAGTLTFTNNQGKNYEINDHPAVLLVRPRGLHLDEKHIEIAGENACASLMDFGIFFYNNAIALSQNNAGPFFYLPKLEHYHEAKWWNDVFVFAQNYLSIPLATIKATVLIETITAAFQMDEILHELKDHSSGLNCGRWDYIFSFIKKFRNLPEFTVPNRDQVTMTSPFMEAYSKRLIHVCHKRNVHAMGGMAAQIPVKNNDAENEIAFAKVRADKEREVKNGHDGTWVAHPALVAVAMEVFNLAMTENNQIQKEFPEYQITENHLLQVPSGTVSEDGVRKNIKIAILYIESWLRGVGAAALYHLMEDAATAEISRTQIWQWLKNKTPLADGRALTISMVQSWQEEELQSIEKEIGTPQFNAGKFPLAISVFEKLVYSEDFQEFLTLEAYQYL